MLSIYKSIPKQMNSFRKCLDTALCCSVRSYYTPEFFKIDTFKAFSEKVQQDNAQNAPSIKLTIQEALSKPDAKIFTEDLKTYLYMAKTDNEIKSLIEAVTRHQSQDALSMFNYDFAVPLMRLLYTLNKHQTALELFNSEESNMLNNSNQVALMLMNKLTEEKKYDEALKVGKHFLKFFKISRNSNPSKVFSTIPFYNLLTECLLEKNTAEALSEAKELLKQAKDELKLTVSDKSIMRIFILALAQKDPDYAFELINKLERAQPAVLKNLKVLALTDLNRTDEALNIAIDISKTNQNEIVKGLYFRTTLENLMEKVGNNAEKKSQVQSLIDLATREVKFIKYDLREYSMRIVEQNLSEKNKRLDQNNRGNQQGGRIRMNDRDNRGGLGGQQNAGFANRRQDDKTLNQRRFSK